MGQAAKRSRENRTITVDFQDETTYFQLLGNGKAFVELVLAFPHSTRFSGKRIVSYGEGRSTLNLPLIHEVQSQDQPKNNNSNIKRLQFYH
jgi:hypothetical protein